MKNEQVFVCPRDVLFHGDKSFQGITFNPDHYMDVALSKDSYAFMDRAEAEENPDYKQIIPYCVLMYENEVLSYERGKRVGEQRLAGQRSIGYGGHLRHDESLFLEDAIEYYNLSVMRELREELSNVSVKSIDLVAAINDDSNDVGKVHFGFVHIVRLAARDVKKREDSLNNPRFMKHEDLKRSIDKYEGWSRLLINNLNNLKQHKKAPER